MTPINIADSWHYKFLSFMGKGDRVYIKSEWRSLNTCSYVRTLCTSTLSLLLWVAGVFTVAFSFTMNTIVAGIFVWYTGFSRATIVAARESLPTFLEFMWIIQFGALLIAVVLGALFIVLWIASNVSDFKQSSAGAQLLAELRETSTAKIVSAWHDKICVPLTVDPEHNAKVQDEVTN